MPAHDLKCDVGRAVRVGILALSFVVFTAPAGADPSPRRRRECGPAIKSGDVEAARAQAQRPAPANAAPGTTAGLRGFSAVWLAATAQASAFSRVPSNARAPRPGVPRSQCQGSGRIGADQPSARSGARRPTLAPAAPATAAATRHCPASAVIPAAAGATGPAVASAARPLRAAASAPTAAEARAPPMPSAISGQGAREGSDICLCFRDPVPPQQARVMQRCKEVVARPALADPNQLTICQTLMAMAKR